AFEEEKRNIASQKKAAQATSTNILSTVSIATTPYVSTASTPTGANANASDTLLNDGIFNGAYDDDEDVGVVADFNNMDNTIAVSPIPTLRIHKDHPKGQILGDPTSAVQTRGKIQKASSAQQALTISQALKDESWVEAMQEELLQFKLQQVWILMDLPFGKKAIGTKWVFRNNRDKRNIVVKNKGRLVAQGHRQEEGIDYDEVFEPVARIETIRLFLAFASYMGFIVYQMDVKSAFLFGTIEEEVYVHQPPGFVDIVHPNKVYKVVKALYGLHQAPRAWYETLSSFLLENSFRRGTIDKTLFIKKNKSDIMLVQVYVDDIIFGYTKKSICTEFEEVMLKRFQMSSMGELTFFLGLQVKQQPDGIFISQGKYVADILKMFDFCSIKTATTPIELNKPLCKDEDGVECLFVPVKALWYPRDSPFDLEAFSEGGVQEADNCGKFYSEAAYVVADHFVTKIKKSLTFGGQHWNVKSVVTFEGRISMDLRMDRSSPAIQLIYGLLYVNTGSLYVNSGRLKDLRMNRSSTGKISFFTLKKLLLRTASLDSKEYFLKMASVRSKLQLADATGIHNLSDAEIYAGLATLGPKSGGWDQFGSTIATALICLSSNRVYNFSKMIFDGMVHNLESNSKFLMYPRFLQIILDITTENKGRYLAPTLTKKLFANMKRGYAGDIVPLLPAMLAGAAVDQGEGSAQPAEPHHTPVDPIPSTSHSPHPSPQHQSPPHSPLHHSPYQSPPHSPHHSPPQSSPHFSPPRSYEAPLPEGNTSGSAEDSVQLKELMVLVPKLVTRINSLEKELKDTKQTLGNVVLKLVKKVKTLETALKRKSKKVLISESEGEESEDQGRKFQDIDDDPLVSLVRESMKEKSTDFVTPTKASGEAHEEEISPTILEAAKTLSKVASQGVSKEKSTDKGKRYRRRARSMAKKIDIGLDAEEEINTGREEINTGIEEVSTDSTKVYSGTASKRGQREGKAPMVEEDIHATHKTKEQLRQEEAGLEEAIKLQAQLDKEVAKAKLEANAELSKDVLGQDLPEQDFAKRMVDMVNQRKKHFAEERAKAKRNKPMTQSQLRIYMSNYLKNQGTWKLSQLKKLNYKGKIENIWFGAMIKDFTREDLIELYRFYLELTTSTKDDRKYPLSKEACQVMLKMKLLDGKMNEDCYKILKMIEKQAGIRK
ncbi:putative ribonuclease H-like domain-containing protein, partial [Tanacetum coccineum]